MAAPMDREQRQLPSVSVRPMAEGDISAAIAIDRLSFATTWSRESYARDLANPCCIYLVAESDGLIVGFGGMWVVQGDSHVTTLAVHPKWRRRGIGRRLLIELIAEARARGAEKMGLEVRVSNDAAQRLYEQYGFATVACLKGYYMDTGEDAFLMVLNPLTHPDR